MAGPQPPNPGVSQVTGSGARVQDGPAPERPSFSRRAKGPGRGRNADPLLNPEHGRRVNSNAAPVGAKQLSNVSDIRDMSHLINQKRSVRGTRTFNSVDGQSYTFATREPNGEPIKGRMFQALYLAIREARLGGDPFVVFDAFGLKIDDLDGKQVYPVMDAVQTSYADSGDEEAPNGFSLGE